MQILTETISVKNLVESLNELHTLVIYFSEIHILISCNAELRVKNSGQFGTKNVV